MTKMLFDVTKIRRDFPILSLRVNGKPLIYLDNAATSQKPRSVIDKSSKFYKLQNANVHRGSHFLSNQATSSFENARDVVASFINAPSSKEVIWCKGTTEAINLVANSLAKLLLERDDVILVSGSEHHANLVPWQLIAKYHHLKVIEIPLTSKLTIDVSKYTDLLIEYQPKIIALGHVSNATGIIHPIQELVALAKEHNAITVVDGAQAVGHMPIDVQKIGCDFYCFSSHKCLGPTGIGVLWGREVLLNRMPPWQGGGEMIKNVSFEGTDFNELPFKFEAGTPPIADAVAFAEAIEYFNRLDRQGAEHHEQRLLERLYKGCKALKDVNVISPLSPNAGIISFTVDGIHHQDIAVLLDHNGIAVRSGHHCAMPLMHKLGVDGTLRASISFYNTLAEIDSFLESLVEVISLLGAPSSAQKNDSMSIQCENKLLSARSFPLSTDITDQLIQANTWQQRFSYIMSLADYLPSPSKELLVDRYKLQQCESGIWLKKVIKGQDEGYQAWSDARIIRGIIVMLISCKNDLSEDISLFLDKVKLSQFLSPSRTNGIISIAENL